MPADPTLIGTWLGIGNGAALFVVGAIRHRRLDAADMGPAAVGFLGSYNLWPPVVLMGYALDPAARTTLPPALGGYEKYIAFAAFCSLLVALIGIGSAYNKAWRRG